MSNKELQAFEEYYRLTKTGIQTSSAINQIADMFDVTTRTIYKWKNKGDWDRKATERSIKLNEEIASEIKEKSDQVVKDHRKSYIKILRGLVAQCVRKNNIEISNVRELLQVIELATKLQTELDIGTTQIISSEYSREKHIKEINGLLGELKVRDEKRLKEELKQKGVLEEDEGGLHKTKILEPGQADLRVDSTG